MNDNQNKTICSGRCAECAFQQRVFCAAYMARNNYAMMESVLARLDSMQTELSELHKRISAIQSNEGELIKPFITEPNLFDEQTQ